MTAPDYGRSFALWRAAAAQDWQDYTRHLTDWERDNTLDC